MRRNVRKGASTIKILLPAGKRFTLTDLSPQTSILTVKQKIQELEGMLAERQLLIYAGTQMVDDGQTLSHYRVWDNSTVVVVEQELKEKKDDAATDTQE